MSFTRLNWGTDMSDLHDISWVAVGFKFGFGAAIGVAIASALPDITCVGKIQ